MITEYKKTLRKLKISHQNVADYTGHARETITNWLNGVATPPKIKEEHIEQEIKEMIELKKEE